MDHVYKEESDIGICEVCWLVEGSLTTDCPGKESHREYGDAVYEGRLDYREGRGWVRELSPMGWWNVYGKISDFYLRGLNQDMTENELILSLGVTKEEYEDVKRSFMEHMYKEGR